MFAGGCVGLLPRYLENACIDLHQTWSVGKGSDHLQLIKFCPSRAAEGGLRLGENFWFRLTTASTQCLRFSERFFFILVFVLAQTASLTKMNLTGAIFATQLRIVILFAVDERRC